MKLWHIYLLSFAILGIINHDGQKALNRFSRYQQSPRFITTKEQEFKQSFKNPDLAKLLTKYVTGYKKRIPVNYIDAHQTTGTLHLFTPSGIHFSSLLSIILILKLILNKKYHPMLKFIRYAISFSSLFLPGLYSLKRIAIFHLIGLPAKALNLPLHIHLCFILTFLIDLFFGSFVLSTLSFTYSLLFWGAIITTASNGANYKIIFALFGARILLCYFTLDQIFLPSIIFNSMLTLLFCLIFPLIFTLYWIPFKFNFVSIILEFIIKHYWGLMDISSKICQTTGGLYPDLLICALIMALSIWGFNRALKILTIIVLILFSPSLNFNPKSSTKLYPYSKSHISIPPNNQIEQITYQENGKEILFSNKTKCYQEIAADSLSLVRCRQKSYKN